MARWQVTVRCGTGELRGYCEDWDVIVALAKAVQPFGCTTLAGEVEDDYDPFRNWPIQN